MGLVTHWPVMMEGCLICTDTASQILLFFLKKKDPEGEKTISQKIKGKEDGSLEQGLMLTHKHSVCSTCSFNLPFLTAPHPWLARAHYRAQGSDCTAVDTQGLG